ncbi:Daxx-like protein [Carabus blaptoides fortunei]
MKKLSAKRLNKACHKIEPTAENVVLPVEQNSSIRMSVYPIVISDSSDDEENPKKKIKLSHVDVCTVSDIRISKVTSLAVDKVQSSSEIVIIEDDEETRNGSKMDGDNISINSDVLQRENNVCKTESITNVANETMEPSSNDICNNAVCELNSENGNDDVVSNNEGPSDSTSASNSVPTNGSDDNVREISPEFNEFLAQCVASECDKKHVNLMIKKIPAMKERYLQAHPDFVNDKKFVKLLFENSERMEQKPANAILYFNNVWEELGVLKETDNVELTDRQAMHIKKLNVSLLRINKKIKKIEEKPVNWDDDGDSTYIQLERYRKRFCDIHKKLCSYTKQNPFAGRPMFRKLDFTASKYEHINRAIDKLYSKNKSFPTHCEVDQCVRKCVRDNNLTISDDVLTLEIKHVFTAMGKLLQKRRKTELRITLDEFQDATDDPALSDANLKSMLDKQYEDGKVKIEAVFQKYTDKQEAGEDPAVSSDSDDSNHGSGSSEYGE